MHNMGLNINITKQIENSTQARQEVVQGEPNNKKNRVEESTMFT